MKLLLFIPLIVIAELINALPDGVLWAIVMIVIVVVLWLWLTHKPKKRLHNFRSGLDRIKA